jgi:hypothetical protein
LLDRLEDIADEAIADDLFAETLDFLRQKAKDDAAHCGLVKPKIGIFEGILLRQMQGVCSGLASSGLAASNFSVRQKSRLKRIGVAFRYMYGRGNLPSQREEWQLIAGTSPTGDDGEVRTNKVTFMDAAKIAAFRLPSESEKLLVRYLKTRIAGRTYFGTEGWGLPVLQGMRSLLALAAIVIWHAKAHAAACGSPEVRHLDIRNAVLLVEHTFGHLSTLNVGMSHKALQVVNRSGWPQKILLASILP